MLGPSYSVRSKARSTKKQVGPGPVRCTECQKCSVHRVRKKFNNLATQAKSLHAQYKGDLVATGGGCTPEELPSCAAFIVERILPPVVLEGLDGGFESGVTAPIAEAVVEAVDYSLLDDRDMDMDVWGIVPAEVSVLTPIDTPDPAPTQRPSARKLSPKELF
uniref:Uncharacterized protein n=1 Tax=Plectus sambesii TaxID=2011161 RepID=A0A914WJZ8_9BILA